MASLSASECTATVRMPISLQARWTRSAISPRLAMRIFSNIVAYSRISSGSPNSTGWPSSTRICATVPALGRRDRVHRLHRLDDQQGLARRHRVADLDEGGGARLGRQVDGADHRRLHRVLGGLAGSARRGRRGGTALRPRRGGRRARALGGHRRRLARHAGCAGRRRRTRSRSGRSRRGAGQLADELGIEARILLMAGAPPGRLSSAPAGGHRLERQT